MWAPVRAPGIPGPDMDPLTEKDSLQEAQLLDLRVHAMSSTVGLLFELRTALQLASGNAAILVMRGARQANWRAVERGGVRTAWTVAGSVMHAFPGSLELNIEMFPSSSIEVLGVSAEFYVLDVPGIDDAPPDYCSGDEGHMRSGLPDWDSSFSLLQASYLQ